MSPEELAEAVLKAAGSGLRYYTLPSVRAAIFTATQQGIRQAVEEEREACAKICEQAADILETESQTEEMKARISAARAIAKRIRSRSQEAK